ncbi:RAxF-45 family protein [Metabacillus sp. Hm71]|uniref:RAxF-45 family protein n=1 Tax=Metabacillus sp. Hm71 TaxID=3450743 RepID=UPI003F4302A4
MVVGTPLKNESKGNKMEENNHERRWGRMLNQAVLVHGFWTEFLYLNRAKFAASIVNGIRMPFFSN